MIERKHILVSALGLVVIVLAVFGYLSFSSEPVSVSPYAAMPKSTSAVLSINNYSRTFQNILMNNLMWQELRLDPEIEELAMDLILLDSLIKSNSWSSDLSEDMKWYMSFHIHGDHYEHVFIVPTEKENSEDFLSWFELYAKQVESYSVFEEVEILLCEFKDSLFNPVYFTNTGGLFIASSQPNLVEDAIRSLSSGNSLQNDENFKIVENTAGSFADWNFFVNYKNPGCLNLLGLNIQTLAESDIKWSDWTALDATVHPDLLLLNGFSHANSDSYLSLFSKQKSQDVDAVEIIPEDVSLFFHFGVSNYTNYTKSKKEYFKKIGKEEAYLKKIASVKDICQIDLETEFNKWIGNEFGVMFLDANEVENKFSKVAYFRLSDVRLTSSMLENLASMFPEEQKGEMLRIPVENFLDDFETVLFHGLNKPYFIILDKYLLLSEQEELLKRVRYQYLQANTLKKSEMYANFAAGLSDQSNVYLYIHLDKGREIYKDLLNSNSIAFFEKNPTFSKKFEHLGIQFKDGKNDMYYQHVSLSFNPKQRSQGNILWEAVLDTDLLMKPQIVYNHYNNSREVLIQDVANTIYLLDNKGNLLWKRQMKEKIMSKVHQIDVYKNNKLQMLFNGESSIYLLDRKGRDVENFPVQLPALATNDLAVIDYEKNREYRILIGVRGGEILNFDAYGKKIKGWRFKSDEEITYPIKYFLLNGNDYIVTAGSGGTPFVLNRKGEERLKIKESLPPYSGKEFALELNNEINQCRMVTTDASGNFIKLKFNGEKEIINLEIISNRHEFLYEDVNNDRKNDYILLDSTKLMVFNFDKEKLFEIGIEEGSPANLNMYYFDNGYGKIGYTDRSGSQAYLYRDAGGLDPNFPLKGSTAYTITDLNKDGRQNLITGLGKKLIVYNLK